MPKKPGKNKNLKAQFYIFQFSKPGEKITRIFTKLRKNIQNANDNTQRMYWADAFEKLICEHF